MGLRVDVIRVESAQGTLEGWREEWRKGIRREEGIGIGRVDEKEGERKRMEGE